MRTEAYSIQKWFFVINFLFIFGCAGPRVSETDTKLNKVELQNNPYVILVSIDGYRHDYTDLYSPPALSEFRNSGSSAVGIMPVYPSKTFTNHYSIATGLYAENHGIVANSFYDPTRKETFKLSDRSKVTDGSWYGGEPLWVATEKQGLIAATYFWPGSDAAIDGVRPTYYYSYDEKVPLEQRVGQVRKWLELPSEKRPHFMTLYFSDVDSAGHKFGPGSTEVKDAIFKVDHAIALLQEEVKKTNLPVDIVIVSDHGMQELDEKKIEYLDDYTDMKSIRIEGVGPQVMLYFDDKSKIDGTFRVLKKKARHYKIFKREKMPKKYHYSTNPRIGDLVIVSEAPYSVVIHGPKAKIEKGNHGYDPDITRTMWGIFYAKGPHIKNGLKLEPFRNIHVYPFIMKLLGLQIMTGIDGDSKVLETVYQPQVQINEDKTVSF